MISVVIVNWNSGPLLERCVRSLRTHAAGCSLTIVDNASTDGSLDFAPETGEDLVLLRNARNLGFAAASNLGWRASTGDPVLFLNPDTECLPGSVSRLEETLQCDPRIWAVGGRLLAPSGKSQSGFNVRRFPSLKSAAADAFFLDEIWPSNPWSAGMRLDAVGSPMDVDQPAAACLMVSRSALESIGGFDESFYPAWFEDVDLCRRIRNQGGRIQYHPEAGFIHQGGYSLHRMEYRIFLESFYSNQIRYFWKHHGSESAKRVRKIILAALRLRAGISLLHSPVRHESRVAAAKSFWSAARRISRLHEAE
ncbi:MAG: glycosyltransferase family 2 protein [Acidobacteriota bacterium]|nr:glycosyltransferase family 2 protein [Acidobacteriota bacterium]